MIKATLSGLSSALASLWKSRLWPILSFGMLLAFIAIILWPIIGRVALQPFLTTGRVFVESPEVYTRERLVNDRYEQAYWLRKQFDAIDAAKNFTSVRRQIALSVADKDINPESLLSLGKLSDPPFEYEFQIRTALRDRIRQMILENQLDDRHDLTGNSVYGLKFDTSVIPGWNTRSRAYVKVMIDTQELIEPGRLPEILRQSSGDLANDPDNDFHRFPTHYEQWLGDIQRRLNTYLSKVPGQSVDIPASQLAIPDDDAEVNGSRDRSRWVCVENGDNVNDMDWAETGQILREALSKVLAEDSRDIVLPSLKDFGAENVYLGTPIGLSQRWNRYMIVQLRRDGECRNRFRFQVERVHDTIILAPEDEFDLPADESIEGQPPEPAGARKKKSLDEKMYFQITSVELAAESGPTDFRVYVWREQNAKDWVTEEEFRRIQPKITIDKLNGQEILANRSRNDFCLAPGTDGECTINGRIHFVESGLFNFTKAVLSQDYYLYAVFPKSDVSGLLERSVLNGELGLPVGGGQGRLSATRSEEAARLITSQVSYSEGEKNDKISFGWIIGTGDIQRPVQKSQFVLLSLPAYLRHLDLQIQTGWMDGFGNFVPKMDDDNEDREEVIPMKVTLPADYEAFDTLISAGKRYGPAIFDRQMEQYRVKPCHMASILIPGARLWRSTLVTLAGQPADQIVVMPDMQGIIARFDPVSATVPENPTLQVWTSEGSARIEGKVTAGMGDGTCPPEQSGDDGP